MQIRAKKLIGNRIIRLQADGEIKEIIINDNLIDKKSMSICFRGEESSGIIDLSEKEIEEIYKELKKEKSLIKEVKIIKNS